MASKTIRSSAVTFLDYTDNRKLDVYITSTLPTYQIYNPNTKTYSPDWSSTNLVLNADVFLDSQKVTENEQTVIKWYKQVGGNAKIYVSDGASIIVAINEMSGDVTMITYICEVAYQESVTAHSQITFARVNTGTNGTNGVDGTSVDINGTAYYNGTLVSANVGQHVTLYADTGLSTLLDTSTLSKGDAYIVQGYLCVYDIESDNFICTGKIQGPPGAPGENAKGIILNADAQMFKVSKNNTVSPSTILITSQAINTSVTQWTYSTNGGQTFLSSVPSGVSRNGDQVTITGAHITSNIIVIKASDGTYSDTYTIYKVFDGTDGAPGNDGQSASMAFLTNENIAFSADAQGQIATTSVTTNVVAYNGVTKVIPTLGEIVDLPDGMTIEIDSTTAIDDEVMLLITIENNATLGSPLSTSGTVNIPVTSPINTNLTLSWSKINTGATGAHGTDAITFQVYSSDGYILSNNIPSVTLQTFAYYGDVPIAAGATYQWYCTSDNKWVELTKEVVEEIEDETTGETTTTTTTVLVTTPYAEIYHTDVSFSCSYMCKMKFNGAEYVDVVTIEDKQDTNIVYTSKPTSYTEGDIWIVGSDYIPSGVEVGTVLKAQYTNTDYADTDWVAATKYDDKISNIEDDVNTYKQYISLDTSEGIRMNAVDKNGIVSDFSTTLSNKQLSFNQGDEAVAYINNHKMHITEAEIESPLTVTGKYSGSNMLQAPTINLGNFSFVVESNGSLSIVSNL